MWSLPVGRMPLTTRFLFDRDSIAKHRSLAEFGRLKPTLRSFAHLRGCAQDDNLYCASKLTSCTKRPASESRPYKTRAAQTCSMAAAQVRLKPGAASCRVNKSGYATGEDPAR